PGERAADPADPTVLEQVGGEAPLLGLALRHRQPAHVREVEALQRAAQARAVPVRRVRVALVVGEGVVLAVIGHPVNKEPLDGHRAEHGKRVADGSHRVERAVGEEAVVADGDPEAGRHVHDAEDREVGPADPLIPQQHDRTQEGNEGNEDGAEVRVLLELRHRFEHTEVICAVLPSIGTSAMPKLEQSHNPPWEQLDPSVPGLVDEVIAAVGAAVPEYEGQLDANVRRGVQQGLEGFLQLVAGDDTVRLPGREVYVAFGRGEWRAGRSLEALLAAYRAGAQVAWRELSATGDARGLPPRTLYTLAEAIFAYIDEI